MERSLLDAVPELTQAITACIARPRGQRSPSELTSALKCLESWIDVLPARYVPLSDFRLTRADAILFALAT